LKKITIFKLVDIDTILFFVQRKFEWSYMTTKISSVNNCIDLQIVIMLWCDFHIYWILVLQFCYYRPSFETKWFIMFLISIYCKSYYNRGISLLVLVSNWLHPYYVNVCLIVYLCGTLLLYRLLEVWKFGWV